MKKTILATSIMFSTLMLGANIFVESATSAFAVENTETQDNKDIIQNKIRFEESDGAYVRSDDGLNVSTYSGKKGDKIHFKLPTGYDLLESGKELNFENNSEIRVVKVKPKVIDNTIILIRDNGQHFTESITITGKTNSKVDFPMDKIPKGYRLLFTSDRSIKISALNKIQQIYVTDQLEVNNKLIFVDSEGNKIKEQTVYGNLGSRYDITYVEFEYDEYKLASDQSSTVVLKEDNSEVKVKVVSNKKKNTLIFKDSRGKEINRSDVWGGIGRSINIYDYLLKEYSPVNENDETFMIQKDNDVKEIIVCKSKDISNKIIFKDEKGNVIGNGEISGTPGEKYNIDNQLPDDYILVNDNDEYLILDDKDDAEHIVRVRKGYFENTLIFKDVNGKLISKEVIKGKIGDDIYPDSYVPKGYTTKHKEDSDKFDDKGTAFEYIVLSNDMAGYFTNVVLYVDENGKEISRYQTSGQYFDEYDVSEIKGFKIVGNNKIKIQKQDGYIHKISVKTLTLKNKITLIDHYTKEKLTTIELNGLTGQEITNDKIPSKYKIFKEYHYYISPEENEYFMEVCRVIKANINFVDTNGKSVGHQKSDCLDKDKIKLNVPKGYKQAMGNGYIDADYRSDSYNVLVVPVNSAAKPTPNPTPSPQPGTNTNDKKIKVTTQINFMDKDSKRTVHSYEIKGHHGETVNVNTPSGYELVDDKTNKITLDKSKKTVTIYVHKKSSTSTVTPHSSAVQTKQAMTMLFDKNGNKISNRALGFNSSWKTNQKMILNGITYHRVATNEYVKDSEVVEYTPNISTIQTKTGTAKYLYDINGKQSGKRALASNTAWYSDRSATINGETMYRVATNEWVKASDIQ